MGTKLINFKNNSNVWCKECKNYFRKNDLIYEFKIRKVSKPRSIIGFNSFEVFWLHEYCERCLLKQLRTFFGEKLKKGTKNG